MRTGNTPDAKQIGPMDMPPSDHMPMDKALSIVKMPMDGPMDMDGPMHGMDGPTDSPMDDMPQMDPKDDEADEDMSGGFSSSTTEPDEQYFDTQTMTHDLAGGINRTKKQHAPAADGDNPIAVEDDLDAQIESIKDELYAALAEKTGKDKKSPPDYPDLDNDGNKEEPMSQAIAQRDDDKEDTDEADTSYSITGKSKEANAELARLAELSGISAPEADIDEWETDPEEHNQAAIESWHDEVVSAITSRNITFPIAEPKIQKVADVVADDWGDQGPSEDVVLSIINGENDQTTQDTMEAGSDEISRDEVHNYAAKVLPAIADKIMSGKYSEDQVISLLLKKSMLDSKEFDFSGALVPTTNEASTEDYANAPDEQYGDVSDVIRGGTDLNKSKKSHAPVAGGDNPMALASKIKEELSTLYKEYTGESIVKEGSVKAMMQDCEEGMSKAEFEKKYPGADYAEVKQDIKDNAEENN
jgi:hypothetical protein